MRKLLRKRYSVATWIPIGIAALAALTVAAERGSASLERALHESDTPNYYVNAGGCGATDWSGAAWEPDRSFDEEWGFVGDRESGSWDLDVDGVYRCASLGQSFGYQFVVPNGEYNIKLYFLEPELEPGGRQFDVKIEGEQVLEGFDIAAEAGGTATGIERGFVANVEDGRLEIEFKGDEPGALVNAIAVEGLSLVEPQAPPTEESVEEQPTEAPASVEEQPAETPTPEEELAAEQPAEPEGTEEPVLDESAEPTEEAGIENAGEMPVEEPEAASDEPVVDEQSAEVEQNLPASEEPTLAAIEDTAAPVFYEQYVNVGQCDSVEWESVTWAADQAYSAGSWGHVGNSYIPRPPGYAQVSDSAGNNYGDNGQYLHRCRAFGTNFGYRFDVPNGEYYLRLRFVEPVRRPGQRWFDVLVEGQLALDDYDIAAETGGVGIAKEVTFLVTVADGQLAVDFVGDQPGSMDGNAIVQAIALIAEGSTADNLAASPTPEVTETPEPPVDEGSQPSGNRSGRNGPALLIKHGWDIPYAQFVHDHVAEMEQMPFDGVVITFDYASHVQSQTPVSYEQFRSALAPVRNTTFTTMSHNFVMVYATPAGSFFDDYSKPVDNFRHLARAAREAGLEGILFDNERYFGNVWDWPDACPNHSLEECNDQARARGREVMQAMIDEWPDIVVMSFYGPWVSDSLTAGAWGGILPYNDVAWANELMGPFFVGMVEATLGTDAMMVDGGEIYTMRTPEQFEAVYNWQHDGMAEQSSLIPDDLRSAYPGLISASFGVYDRPWLGQPMNAAIWGETIEAALRQADDYVWVYTEAYDWWGGGWPQTFVSQSWVDATVQARANAGSDPLSGGDPEPTPTVAPTPEDDPPAEETQAPPASEEPTVEPTEEPGEPGGSDTPEAPSAGSWYVNAGTCGDVQWMGQVWLADQPYTAGSWGHVGSDYQAVADDVADPVSDETHTLYDADGQYLHKCQVYGQDFGYWFDLPNGSYEIHLRFAEPLYEAGERWFDVLIEGAVALDDFDVSQQAGGQDIAIERAFIVTVADEQLRIDFVGGQSGSPDPNALLQAIGVVPAESAAEETPDPATPDPATPDPATPDPATPDPATPEPTPDSANYEDPDSSSEPPAAEEPPVDFQPYSLYVNAGQCGAAGWDGVIWAADQDYSNNGWGRVGTYRAQPNLGARISDPSGIRYTGDAQLLHRCRVQGQSFGYRFDVPNGTYQVRLRFAEPRFNPGRRWFDVAIEGQVVLDNFDIAAEAGERRVAVERTFEVEVTDGQLAIDFQGRQPGSHSRQAIVQALGIVGLDTAPDGPPTSSDPLPPGDGGQTPSTTPDTATPTPLPTSTPMPGPSEEPEQTATAVSDNLTADYLPSGQSDQWALVFHDEFNGNALDQSVWTDCYWWDWEDDGCTNRGNNELQWYTPDNVLVSEGTLKLRAQQQTVWNNAGERYLYTSGMVTTGPPNLDSADSPGFVFQYGYVEARARVPSGDALWPAIWLLNASLNPAPEIDIVEILGQDPNTVEMHFHYSDEHNYYGEGKAWTGPDFSAGWHIFGLDWNPDYTAWYVDGVERWRSDSPQVPKEPMYLIMNLAVGGDWPGSPTADTPFPSFFEIDYIRVWEQMNGG